MVRSLQVIPVLCCISSRVSTFQSSQASLYAFLFFIQGDPGPMGLPGLEGLPGAKVSLKKETVKTFTSPDLSSEAPQLQCVTEQILACLQEMYFTIHTNGITI